MIDFGSRLIASSAGTRSLREHLLTLASGGNPKAPVHPRSFGIIHTQNGRVGTLSNQFTDLLISGGLREPRDHQGRGIGRDAKRTGMDTSFHSLRHTAVSLLKDAGIPDAVEWPWSATKVQR
jgi:hypothetical protein